MIACDRIISPPPPRPCTPRQTTSQVKSGDSAAPRLASGEQPDRDEEQVAAAPQVAELAVDRHDQGGGQQVGGGHPRHVRDAAEVADDGRHRRGDDRLVERGHEHAGEQRREDQVDPAPGEDDRRRGERRRAGRARVSPAVVRRRRGCAAPGERTAASARWFSAGAGQAGGERVPRLVDEVGERCGEVAGEPAVQGGAHRGAGDAGQQGGIGVDADPRAGALGDRPSASTRSDSPKHGGQPAEQRRVGVDDLQPQRPQLGLLGHLGGLLAGDRAQRLDGGLAGRPGEERRRPAAPGWSGSRPRTASSLVGK